MWHDREQVSKLADHVPWGHCVSFRMHRRMKQMSTDMNPHTIRSKGAFAHQMAIANHAAMRGDRTRPVDE